MLSTHGEIREELEAIRKALHGYVLTHQVAPPDGLREKIVNGVKPAPKPATTTTRTGSATSSRPTSTATLNRQSAEPSSLNIWMIAAAVSVLGLIGALVYYSGVSGDLEASQKALVESQANVEQLKKEKETQVALYEKTKAELDLRSDHNLVPIPLKGNSRAPEAFAVIRTNKVSKKSYLDVRKLPDVPADQQLQLWVTVNGQTTNLGTPKVNQPNELPELKYSDNPSIYFVTLEKKGDAPQRPSRWRIVMTTGRI